MDMASNTDDNTAEITNDRQPETAEYVANVKEKAALKEEIAEVTREWNKAKGQNYDLLKKIEKLEKENSELKKDGKSKGRKAKPMKRKVPRKTKKISTIKPEDEVFETQEALYAAIAEKHPDLPLSQVLFAEKKFIEADINNDGTIDAEELEKILDSSSLMFTKSDVKEILTEIDVDGTNSLDFLECLAVCDLLRANRNSRMPQSIQQNKSTLCSIQ